MLLLVETKTRSFLVFLNWSFNFVILYYYKTILLYLLTKQFNYNKLTNFYLICTNVSELFYNCIQIVNFFSNNTVLCFFVYHTLIFVNLGLYVNERQKLKQFFILMVVAYNLAIFMLIPKLIPIVWVFFNSYQYTFSLNFVHFELKMNDFFMFLKIGYYFCIFYCVSFLTLFVVFKHWITKNFLTAYRKINLFLIVTAILLLPTEITIQLGVIFTILVYYELILLLLTFTNLYK